MSKARRAVLAVPLLAPLAATPGMAADLPVIVEPVDYVTVCNAYGIGFYTIPGTGTCLRISTRLRVDYNIAEYDELFAETQGRFGTFDGADLYRTLARANVYFDARTQTEFGLLRTYIDLDVRRTGTGSTAFLSSGYIEFGGFLLGRAQSRYDFVEAFFAPGQAFLSTASDVTTQLIAYTAEFDGGISMTASLEDETARRTGIFANPAFDDAYQGTRIPDIVGNVRLERPWGTAQVMGALHYTDPVDVSDSALGYAVGAGVAVNVPTGRGTLVGVQATFSEGALQYVSSSLAGGRMIGGDFFGTADGMIDANGNLRLSRGVSVLAGFSTGLTPRTSLSFEAGYTNIDQPEVDLTGNGIADGLDYQSFAVDGSLGYSPVTGLLFAVGAQYKHVDMADGPDFGGFSGFLRAQRLF